MAKSKSDTFTELDELINEMEQLDSWDFGNPNDQVFWEEFFQLEQLLEVSDELDPPKFTISVLNHTTGEVKTFSKIHLKSVRKKISC